MNIKFLWYYILKSILSEIRVFWLCGKSIKNEFTSKRLEINTKENEMRVRYVSNDCLTFGLQYSELTVKISYLRVTIFFRSKSWRNFQTDYCQKILDFHLPPPVGAIYSIWTTDTGSCCLKHHRTGRKARALFAKYVSSTFHLQGTYSVLKKKLSEWSGYKCPCCQCTIVNSFSSSFYSQDTHFPLYEHSTVVPAAYVTL